MLKTKYYENTMRFAVCRNYRKNFEDNFLSNTQSMLQLPTISV